MTADAPRGADAPPELVQLLTPEGERVEHPDYALDLTAEEIRGPLPRPGPGPPHRPRGDRAAAAGRARHLGLAARPGGRADRLRPGADRRRHGLPDLPRARRGLVPRRRPGEAARPVPRRRATAAGTPRSTTSTCTRSSSAPRPCTPPATPWASSATARRGRPAIVYFGDGATSQGDVNEAFIWAAVFNAPVVFFCQNNQWAISEPLEKQTPHPALPAGAAASASPASGSTATTCSPASRSTRKALQARPGRAGPDADRGVHLPDGRAHHLRRPDPVPAGRRAGGVEAEGPDRAGQGLPVPHQHRRRGVLRRGRRGGRRARRATCAAGCLALPDPRAAGHVRQRVRRSRTRCSTRSASSTRPTWTRSSGGSTDDHS